MPDKPTVQEGSRKGCSIPACAGVLMASFILYVLSVGPVAMCCKGRSTPDAVEAFYAPLIYLYQNVPVAQNFFDWYLGLWGGI